MLLIELNQSKILNNQTNKISAELLRFLWFIVTVNFYNISNHLALWTRRWANVKKLQIFKIAKFVIDI